MQTYTIKFVFVENGHECKTYWSGSAESKEDAVRIAKDWFGFDVDKIKIIKIEFQ